MLTKIVLDSYNIFNNLSIFPFLPKNREIEFQNSFETSSLTHSLLLGNNVMCPKILTESICLNIIRCSSIIIFFDNKFYLISHIVE